MTESLLAAVSLQLGDYAVIGAMLSAATSLTMWNLRTLSKRLDLMEVRVAKVERCKADLRETERLESVIGKLETAKTDRHEFARENIVARQKVERMSGQLERIDARLQAEFGIAATVKSLADELAKLREVPK